MAAGLLVFAFGVFCYRIGYAQGYNTCDRQWRKAKRRLFQ